MRRNKSLSLQVKIMEETLEEVKMSAMMPRKGEVIESNWSYFYPQLLYKPKGNSEVLLELGCVMIGKYGQTYGIKLACIYLLENYSCIDS